MRQDEKTKIKEGRRHQIHETRNVYGHVGFFQVDIVRIVRERKDVTDKLVFMLCMRCFVNFC